VGGSGGSGGTGGFSASMMDREKGVGEVVGARLKRAASYALYWNATSKVEKCLISLLDDHYFVRKNRKTRDALCMTFQHVI
jgi:hypothetical protein